MTHKKSVHRIFEEIFTNAIGWIAGLLSVDLLKMFFIEKKWINAWGIFSKKTAVNSTTFSILEWTLTAVIGFMVMCAISFLAKKAFFKNRLESKENNLKSE
jgi:hypothetical protein